LNHRISTRTWLLAVKNLTLHVLCITWSILYLWESVITSTFSRFLHALWLQFALSELSPGRANCIMKPSILNLTLSIFSTSSWFMIWRLHMCKVNTTFILQYHIISAMVVTFLRCWFLTFTHSNLQLWYLYFALNLFIQTKGGVRSDLYIDKIVRTNTFHKTLYLFTCRTERNQIEETNTFHSASIFS
jgi:hypothetical protein